MQASSSLRLGRFGPLNVQLHYTWLLAAVLGLWWLALLWLPDNYPGWAGPLYWVAAVAALVLFLLSVVAHELVHSITARTGVRNVILFPFGAAQPFRLRDIEPGRAILSALSAPVFNLVLGGLLLFFSGSTGDAEGATGVIKGAAHALGLLNIGLGLVNLIPGVPFDMGWLLGGAISWFGVESDTALRAARTVGRLASLVLVLAGAWLGLTTDQWLPSLGLVLLGWAAREAASIGRQRGLLVGALDQMRAHQLMEGTRPADVVSNTDTVADMVRAHPRYDADTPLPVLDKDGTMVGIVTIGAADTLLQGTWPATPVTALMTAVSSIPAVSSDTPLTQVLEVAQARRGTPLEEDRIPVVDGGKLAGSINPVRLQPFEQIEREFGMDSPSGAVAANGGFFTRLGAALPAVMIIAAMAILGSAALRTDPAEISDLISEDAEANVTFANMLPENSSFVPTGETQIRVDLESARPISDVVILLDGAPLSVEITGTEPMTATTALATVNGLLLGPHQVTVTASTISGRTKSTSWSFRVGSGGEVGDPNATQVPAGGAVEVLSYQPATGARLLAGSTDVPVAVQLRSADAPASAKLFFNGEELEAEVSPVEGMEERYELRATAPVTPQGFHRVRAEIQGAGGALTTSEWTFSAMTPSESLAYFEATDRFVGQPFLSYWQQNGGLAIFGYPISERLTEKIEETGETYTALYFERARFELHGSTDDSVILGRLGAILYPPEPAAEPIEGAQFFPETGHNLSGKFLDFWNANGGLAVFGYAISEERTEKSALDGKEYRVQYFERNRFELHPEHEGTPFEVQLGQLGTELYKQKYAP